MPARPSWIPTFLATCALAGCGCPDASDPADGVSLEDAPRKEVQEGQEKRGNDPWNDPDDYAGVTPPDHQLGHIAPTPVDAERPAVPTVPTPTTLPNVVVVLGCTVRKDQITPYGGHPEATPFLRALAAEGTVFDDAIAAAPWTRVASTALLTGQHASGIGMVEPRSRRNNKKLPPEITTLAEHFDALGYLTIGATANPNLNADFGFGQGYDHYQLGLPKSWANPMSGARVVKAALRTLAEQREAGDDRPAFLRLMLLDPHAPRHAKKAAWKDFTEDGVPARVAQYRSHLHDLDSALARLDAGLTELGMDASNTVFVFTADHGEGMNYPDHHGYGHGQYFGSSTVYLPWIMRGPGVAAGHRVLGPVSQVDLVPTLLGTVGHPLADDAPTDGRDWSALVRGEAHVVDREMVFSDTWFGGSSRAAVFTATHQCQDDFGSTARQRNKGKFVPGCYDRHDDPLFTTPLELPELMASLHDWREARMADVANQGAESVDVDEATKAQLEMLGYVDEADDDEARE